MALCVPLISAEVIGTTEGQNAKTTDNLVSHGNCLNSDIRVKDPVGCRSVYLVLDNEGVSHGQDNVAVDASTGFSGALVKVNALSSTSMAKSGFETVTSGRQPWEIASTTTTHNHASSTLSFITTGVNVDLANVDHLDPPQEPTDELSTRSMVGEDINELAHANSQTSANSPLAEHNSIKVVRQVTQGPGDKFTTIPLPTGPDPSWMKRQTQGSTDRFSTTPIPTPSRTRSVCTPVNPTDHTIHTPFSAFSTVSPPTNANPTGHKRQVQGSTDRFSTTPIPSPTRTVICAETPGPKTQGPSDLFSTVPLPTGPDPTWEKRQHTQDATDLFSTVPLPTGPDPTWKV